MKALCEVVLLGMKKVMTQTKLGLTMHVNKEMQADVAIIHGNTVAFLQLPSFQCSGSCSGGMK